MELRNQLAAEGYAIVGGAVAEDLPTWRQSVIDLGSINARNLLAVPAIVRLVESSAIRRLVEPVLGHAARPVRGLLFDKREGANWGVGWHQDTVIAVAERPESPPPGFESWSVKEGVPHVRPPDRVLAAMLTVRLALDDADETNGCLQVLPGSHREGLLTTDQIANSRSRVAPQSCVTRAGDALLMRPLLLHASGKADRPGRRVVHLEFAAEPLPDPLRWPDWATPSP